MNEIQLKNSLKEKNIEITDNQLNQLKQYYNLLIEYNKKMNLTAITDKEEVYLKHFYDSMTPLFFKSIEENSTLCDVGSGAGFPSVVLKIMRPDLKVTIVDSLAKRIRFLNELIEQLKLRDIVAIHDRAEHFSIEYRESFDIVTARAVARLNILSELCIPLVRLNGLFIAMKAQSAEEELNEGFKAIEKLGCKLKNKYEFSLPNNGGIRNILIFNKINKTPNKYPRNYSQIKNKPL